MPLLHALPVDFLTDPAVNDTSDDLLAHRFFHGHIRHRAVDQSQHQVLLVGLGMAAFGVTPVQLLPSGGVLVTVLTDAFLGPDDQVAGFPQNGQVADGSGLGIARERDGLTAFPALDIIVVCR